MSADLLAMADAACDAALGHLWRASWQGGIAIALIWGVCWSFPRWSPGVRCWLWRLAYLKLLTSLLWAAPVELPILPGHAVRELADGLGAGQSALKPSEVSPDASLESVRESVASDRPLPAEFPNAGPNQRHVSHFSGGRLAREWPAPEAWLLLVWLLAGIGLAARTAAAWRASRRLISASLPVSDEGLLRCCEALRRRLRLRGAPELMVSSEVGSPVLVGGRQPKIVLPPSLLSACDEHELCLILAHELAHLKRRDLLWAWLPTLAGLLFFFHPLVWLARREWRLAQEMACDELAVRVTGASPLEYGQVVLKVASQRRLHPFTEPAVASAAGAYQSLQRRLVAITQIRPVSTRRWRLIGALLVVTGAAGLVPWRVTERAAAAEGSTPATALPPHARQQSFGPRALRDHQLGVAEQERLRRQETWRHQQRLDEVARLRRTAAWQHQLRLAEEARLRRVEMLAHERRLAELENIRRLQQSEHERRLAEQEQVRFLQRQAHERRLAEREHARRLNQLAARPIQEEADQARLRESQAIQRRLRERLRSQQQRAATLQEQVAQQRQQMVAIQHAVAFLSRQLSELRLQQRSLEAQRQSLEVRTSQKQQEEQLLRERLRNQMLRQRLHRLRAE